MKTLAVMVLFFVGLAVEAAPRTVDDVDLSRYVGRWYQIAHKPMWFDGECACSVQDLTARNDGLIGVVNSCRDKTPAGDLRTISGTATVEDRQTNSKFTVDFGLPWKGTYWIIALDHQYRYAVVTDKDAKSLYVLSKTPTLEKDLYDEALRLTKAQLDLDGLKVTEQSGCTYP